MNRRVFRIIVLSILVFWLTVSALQAQPTEFTYQGRLLSGTLPANGSHDFEFRLYGDPDGNVQIGAAIPLSAVNVNNGVFSVRLDFGDRFPGENRYLEIRVRQTGGEFFTVLTPRQAITSSPYAVKSLKSDYAESSATSTNSTQLGGVAANQFVLTNDTRMSDARNPLPNSPNYIQNSTTQQTSGNFNISGNGTVGGTLSGYTVNAATQYNLAGIKILSVSGLFDPFGITTSETFVSNTFVGENAGFNTTPSSLLNFSSGKLNSFFGANAGRSNTTGSANSFFGQKAGSSNTTGVANSFFGTAAGRSNTLGFLNSFFGTDAGSSNTTGYNNLFLGAETGLNNRIGNQNVFIGFSANGTDGLTNASSIGSLAFVGQSNTIVLGSILGLNGCSAAANCDTVNVGIGTATPSQRLHVVGNGLFTGNLTVGTPEPTNVSAPRLGIFGTTSSYAIVRSTSNNIEALFGVDSSEVDGIVGSALYGSMTAHGIQFRTNNSARMVISRFGDVGIGTTAPTAKLDVNGIIRAGTLGSAGSTTLCRNTSGQIASCSSSIRYKSDIENFRPGLEMIKRLRPVSFKWKTGGMPDLGLVAEEVAEVEPLLTTTNDKGEVEGVKYDRVGIVLINAVNEQQIEIESQQKQIEEQKKIIRQQQEKLDGQQTELDALKKLVCSQNPTADICQPKK